jgi:hypothetical protein
VRFTAHHAGGGAIVDDGTEKFDGSVPGIGHHGGPLLQV